jgi:hypothetical protein
MHLLPICCEHGNEPLRFIEEREFIDNFIIAPWQELYCMEVVRLLNRDALTAEATPRSKGCCNNNINNKNTVALVRERTTSTELPLFFGEVSANFCG